MIVAHVMVKNEYQFIWYSVMSIIHHVDCVFLWDTGSTDGTKEIISEILKTEVGKAKVKYQTYTSDPFDEEKVRQLMLDETLSKKVQKGEPHWFLVVDGDEIWWENSIAKITTVMKEKRAIESIVVPTINTVGDIFHYQEQKAGNYHLAGKHGHYNLRGVNCLIPGLYSKGAHGVWGWADEEGKQIQERDNKKIVFIDAPYLHCTFLQRSTSRTLDTVVTKRSQKLKYEIGEQFPKDFFYPEVLFRERPLMVPLLWKPMSTSFQFRAYLETPLRKAKRRYLPKQVGY